MAVRDLQPPFLHTAATGQPCLKEQAVFCRDLERQHVQDKDAWKKNTLVQLKETRERMQKLSENQLETLTKRTILENEAMAAELKYQSRQARVDRYLSVWV